MTDHLWHRIGPLEAEADQILEDARQEAARLVAAARDTSRSLNDEAQEKRREQQERSRTALQQQVSAAREASLAEAQAQAVRLKEEARSRSFEAVKALTERILDFRGNR